MGQEIVHCHLCGSRIERNDLLAGRALTLLDRTFCHQCKEQAFAQMRGEAPIEQDYQGGAKASAATGASARKPASVAARPAIKPPAPPVRPAPQAGAPTKSAIPVKPAAAPKPAPKSVPAPARKPLPPPPGEEEFDEAEEPAEDVGEPDYVPVPRRHNPLPLYVGGTIGFVALVAILILLIQQAEEKRRRARPADGTTATDPTAGATEETPADKAMRDLEAFVRTNPSPEQTLAKCEEIKALLVKTPHENRWRTILRDAEQRRDAAAGERRFEQLLGEIRTAIAQDKAAYRQFPRIAGMIREAEKLARDQFPERVPDVKELERQYVDPYEDEAKKWADEYSDWIRQLASERRFKDAIAKINTFPERLRQSKVWQQIEVQRDGYQRQLEELTRGGQGLSWKEFARTGHRDVEVPNFANARRNYKKALELVPPNWKDVFTIDEKKSLYALWYNLACMDAEEAKKAPADQKEPLARSALRWLEEAFKNGLFTTTCGDHSSWKDHMQEDKDLDELRNDERFKKLLEQYAP